MKRILLSFFAVLLSYNFLYALELPPVEFDFYGDVKVNAFYFNNKSEVSGYSSVVNGFDINLGKRSYVGASVAMGNLTGDVQLQMNLVNPLRVLAFTYDFAEYGKLTVGKDFTLAGYYFGQLSEDNNYMRGYGTLDNKTEVLIKYGIKGIEVALVSRFNDKAIDYAKVTNINTARTIKEQIFPRVELSYKYSFKYGYVRAFGTYGYYSSLVYLNDGSNKRYGANAFDVGLASSMKFANVKLDLTAFYAYNATLFSALLKQTLMPEYNRVTGKVDNVASFGFAVATDVEVTDNIIVRGGAGYMVSNSPKFIDFANPKVTVLDDEFMVFVGATFKIAKYFIISPEVAYMDSLTRYDGKAEGARLVAGLQFNVIF